jgi:hypothetical protein
VADQPKTPARVPVLAPDPQTGKLRFATVDAKDAEAVKAAGGKLLTKTEALHEEQRAEYEAKPVADRVVGGVVGTATGPVVGNVLGGTGVITQAPEVQAFQQGQNAALTGGLDQIAVKEALEATAGKQAAAAYGKHQLEIKQANEGWHTGGEVTGFAAQALAGGGSGAARALPGVGISALGGATEGLAARALGGVAARGVLGRALATSGELAARGAVEGALYGAANEVTEEALGDSGLAADKIFAAGGHGALFGGLGGAVLGGTGSLAKSTVGGAIGAARGGLSRVLSKGEEAANAVRGAAADAGAKADVAVTEGKALAKGVADEAGTAVAGAGRAVEDGAIGAVNDAGKAAAAAAESPTGKGIRGILGELSTAEGTRGLAYDQAWGAIGKGQGLQATRYAKQAQRYLPNGTRDVGEVMMRKGIINAEDGWLAAAKAGTPEHLLPKIGAELDTVGQRIGDITSASPARVDVNHIIDAVDQIASPYAGKAGQRHIAASVHSYADDLGDVLGVLKQNTETGAISRGLPTGANEVIYGSPDVSVQALLHQRKALDELVYKETKAMDPKMRVQALRDLRTKLEGVITDAMDEASGKVSGELRAEYKALKKDYVALSIAKDVAEDSAARASKHSAFSFTAVQAAAGAAASGHILAAPVVGIGTQLVKERGAAAAAVLLHRAADMGTLAKLMKGVDEGIGRAAQGILTAPKRGPLPEVPVGSVRDRAHAALARIAEAKADPDAYLEKVARNTESLSQSAPELAGALMQKATSYLAFMESKIPSAPPPDPLDPHPVPRLTDAEASRIAKYEWYWQKPDRFFAEVEHGHLTFEGIEVAKAAMPGAFAELQARTAEGLATLMAQKRPPPYAQRQKIGDLLDFPATAAQGFAHAQFLQKNAMLLSQTATGPAKAPPRASTQSKPQRSPLDRLEADGPGRR